MDVDSSKNSYLLTGLQSSTDYLVHVSPLYGQSEGPKASVTGRTGGCLEWEKSPPPEWVGTWVSAKRLET